MWNVFTALATLSALLVVLFILITPSATGAAVAFLCLSLVDYLRHRDKPWNYSLLPLILWLSLSGLRRCLALVFAVLSFLLIGTGIICAGLGVLILKSAYFFLGRRANTKILAGARNHYTYRSYPQAAPPPSLL